nr:hypothetical protein [Neobacillus sp. 179.-C4.2 HS]
MSNKSELDWYEKAQSVLMDHGYSHNEQEPVKTNKKTPLRKPSVIVLSFKYNI